MAKSSKVLRDETLAKLLVLLTAQTEPLTALQLAADPLMGGKATGQMVAGHLRQLRKVKKVKLYPGKRWMTTAKTSTEAPVQLETPTVPADMFFVIQAATKSVHLSIGGLRLPVFTE